MINRRKKIFRFNALAFRSFFVTIGTRVSAQALLEVTFAMVVLVGLILGMVKVFFWVSKDLSGRRAAHEETLLIPVIGNDTTASFRQIRPVVYEGIPIDAANINSEIFGSNRL